MHADDGERVGALSTVMCRAALACFNAVDRVDEMKADAKSLDLGLVIALMFDYAGESSNYGIEPQAQDVDFQKTMLGYARKARINLKDAGVHGLDKRLKNRNVQALKGNATASRWNYSKACNEYMKQSGPHGPVMGGPCFNIMQWTRAERARHAFDEEDPLKDVSEADIKSGKLIPM